jgi:riboflavin kinase/FMN adenylyltransferase
MTQFIRDVRTVHIDGPTFLTIGNFDGLHRGHQALIQRLRQEANAHAPNTLTGLLTFDPHPMRILRPEVALRMLTTPGERVALAGGYGVDLGIIQPFDQEIANFSPRQFLTMLQTHLGLAGLVVGPDFALGKGRSGTLDVLADLGEEMGFRLAVLDEIHQAGTEVRSLTVRQRLKAGDVAGAGDLLGRPYQVTGVVEHGDGRGRTIGVPTANLNVPQDRMLPQNGVYATWAWVGQPDHGKAWMGATNIGIRPTVDGTVQRVECHLIDFPDPGQSDDLYGKEITLAFIARLRGEQKFTSLDALVSQIHQDIDQTRATLNRSRE